MLLVSCTTTRQEAAEPSLLESTTSTTEVERIDFVDETGRQWIELPDPERASYDGEVLTVVRGTTLRITGEGCARPAMEILGATASVVRSFENVTITEDEAGQLRDLSFYIPPLMPTGRHRFTTTCSSSYDLGWPVDLTVHVEIVDDPDLVEQPAASAIPTSFCLFEPRDCDVPRTP